MEKENTIVIVAILYAFLGIGTLIFADWSTIYFQTSSPFNIAVVFLIVLAYNIFLVFSFRRCWNMTFNRQKLKEVQER
ncbi:hypothetical protein LCGC14_0737830 [marine sediment metagenome]|uniref:Uncharacterized protein n=1 Tax=marine sediment metagenome TaxID=412755 RepID=A0A0F9QSM7_9ZZZZ